MQKRIIPISSGKGGVGKTTFAINLALSLSRFGRTILVDLDTGTSSVRSVIESPVAYDLYHFFRKRISLEQCITPLTPALDTQGHYKNFGFIASPLHLVDDIANMNDSARGQLIDAINHLPGEFIILDLKAGIDPGVLDFLPHTNSGVLVFTPTHPAATLAASNIVKTLIFRRLRSLFYPNSPLFQSFPQGKLNYHKIKGLIDETEDAYSDKIDNLDAFFDNIRNEYPGHPVAHLLHSMIRHFDVFYVLNRFDGIEDSFHKIIQPFVENISRSLSPKMNIQNLGWIIESQAYNQSNVDRMPYLLRPPKMKEKKIDEGSVLDDKLNELYVLSGLKRKTEARQNKVVEKTKAVDFDTSDALLSQLDSIEKLYGDATNSNVRQNFDYIVSRIRYQLQAGMVANLGERRLYKKGDTVPLFPVKHDREPETT